MRNSSIVVRYTCFIFKENKLSKFASLILILVEKFLEDYELYIDEGFIEIIFKHSKYYKELIAVKCLGFETVDRCQLAFDRFEMGLPEKYYNLKTARIEL